MAKSRIERIDRLLDETGVEPVRPGDPDRKAVGIIQELLICHGFPGMPNILSTSRGIFGPRTTAAVRDFQEAHGLTETGMVDNRTLHELIDVPAVKPTACHAYIALALDFVWEGMIRLVSLTSQFEGGGSFTAINPNTDGAGLSFGLIQWAQKPGRLHELLCAFRDQCPTEFVRIFGEGDDALAGGLIEHTAKPMGGTRRDGRTSDPAFDLTAEPWSTRFRQAGLGPELQKVQVLCAKDAFTRSYRKLQRYAPDLRSERAIAFMLDIANQHGDGGARNIFEQVFRPYLSERELLLALQYESVARVSHQFGNGPESTATRNRREVFRTTFLLSDEPLTLV